MHTKRYKKLTLKLCEAAVDECFIHKWSRNNILTFIEKYAGIPRDCIRIDDLSGSRKYKEEAISAIGLMLYGVIEDIVDRGEEPDDMEPVDIRLRPDGMTGKLREIALLCVMHQLLGHAVKLMIEPLIRARLLPTQHASIPGRGQTRLKDQAHRYLLKESLGIKYVVKTDVVHAYQTTMYSTCIDILKREIPGAHYAIGLMKYLESVAPGGHLIIGGYIDAWLFNFVISYAIRHIYTLGQTRRGKQIPYVIRCDAFMDDFAIMTRSAKGAKRAIRGLSKWLKANQNLAIKETTGVIKIMPIAEEKRRRSLPQKAQRSTPKLDIAGYRVARSHIVIRRRVFKRVRRQLLRAYTEIQITGTLRICRAKKFASYHGYITQTDSHNLKDKYHVKEILDVAKKVSSHHSYVENEKRKEELDALRKRRSRRETGESDNRVFTGWNAESAPGGQCGGIPGGGSAGADILPF